MASVKKNGVTAGAYQYDGRGLRMVKTVNGETTLFIYCKSGKLIAEADSNGNILKEYVYLEGDIFAHFQYDVPAPAPPEAASFVEPSQAAVPEPVADQQVTALPAVAETSTPSDTSFLPAIYLLLLLNDKSAEEAYYYINDHLGAPQIITDDAGSVVWKAEYLPFGKVNISVAHIENNLRFPGQYYDAETGLHYNWNRYYSPETGRYMAADPIGLDGGINLYAYVGANPVNWYDPEGLHKGDKWYGYNNKDFQKWFHRCWKEPGNPDANKDEIEEAYEEWVRNGKPKGGKCGSAPPEEPEPDDLCGENCQKIIIGVTLTGALIFKYICTGGPFNPAYN